METVIMSREAMTIGTDKAPPILFRFLDPDYSQWKDRFLDFIDRQELGEEILQSLKEGPAEFYVNADPPLPATQEVVNGSSFSEKQNNRLKADDVAILYLFLGLSNEILACIDANQTAKGLWDALSRLMQGSDALMEVARSYECFECFKARDGEFLEVTYNRYCRLLNELRKNGIDISSIYINIKFLKRLKPEWERVATNIIQNQNLSEIDIHALFRILNPLALVADKRQKDYSSSRGLKVNKEPAQSYELRSLMTVGSFKEPPVLFFPDYFSEWKIRFLRFINLQELGKEILQSLKEGPAEFYISADPALPARQEVVNRSSFSEKQNNRIKADRRAKLYLLQGMSDDILACIDSHKTAKGLWDALPKLMQSGALMEVARCYEGFKARDGESLEVTYNRYCRLLNELRMDGIYKSNFEINIKFLNSLKPEWKRVATNIMENQNLSEINIHALFRNLYPLALVADKEPAQSIESRLVMTIGSDKEPPVLFCRCHYSQWKNRFLSFIDWQELGKEILQSLKEGPAEFYINADLPLPARQEVLNRSSLSEKQNNRLKADKVAKSYLRRGMTNEILACIDSYGTAKGMWNELSKQMQGTDLGACTKMIPCEKYFYSGRSLKLDKEPAQLSDSENDGREPYEELKDKMKAMTLVTKAFQKPTNTNQRVSSSIRKPDIKSKYEENKGSEKCYNCGKPDHHALECRKPKVRNSNYWKTKMLLAKQRESGKTLMAEDKKWLNLTDDEEEDLDVNLSQQRFQGFEYGFII